MIVEPLNPERVARAKRAYTTRRVSTDAMCSLIYGACPFPMSGDLVLARVDDIGKQRRIELTNGCTETEKERSDSSSTTRIYFGAAIRISLVRRSLSIRIEKTYCELRVSISTQSRRAGKELFLI
jgi:hypothetical protein